MRLSLVLAPALALSGLDLWVKATVATREWDFHQRSQAWSLIAVLILVAVLLLALLPSRLVAIAAGIVAGGVLGNVVSARLHGGRVPNPLVVGTFALNPADVCILAGVPVLAFALGRVAIQQRKWIDRMIPPRSSANESRESARS